MKKFKKIHMKCGDNCIHLKRFYARLGYIQNKYKRKFYKMKESMVSPFQKDKPKYFPGPDMGETSSRFPKIETKDQQNQNS